MRINSLQLFQFRNYKDLTLDLQPEIIVLYGTNGAGKTNILEAIYVGTIGKSHRTNDTSDMLLFNADEAGIVVNFEKKETPMEELQVAIHSFIKMEELQHDECSQPEKRSVS